MPHRHFPLGPEVTEAALRSHWEEFQRAGAIGKGVRPEIAASWQRSAQARLGPGLPAAPVDEAALRGFDHAGPARRRFLSASAKVADQLVEELQDAVAAAIVCDDFGVVLHRAGQPKVLRTIDEVNLVPGGMWGEGSAGTTGIGLALATGTVSHVYAAEHFAEALHSFSCTATVVRHPVTREALGVLGLATGTSISASFARPLIIRASQEVERRLQDQVLGRELELMEHYLRSRAGRASPFLTVDRAGHTVIQSARMLQTASGNDIALLLELARQALHAESNATEELDLSRGRVRAETRLVREDAEVLGALVSLERIGPRRTGSPSSNAAIDWTPLVGRSPAMRRLFREAGRVADQRANVMIRGEAGSGKLTLARRLHELGGEGPLSPVRCALDGWEAELERAFGARGTAVLLRVHALSPSAQLVLCDRLDDLADRGDAVWVIGLLNSQASEPCPELLYRLAPVLLTVPALRDRGHDLRLLVDRWCDVREQATGTRPVLRSDAHEVLAHQPWPGNVRELFNTLDAAALRGGTVIGAEALVLPGPTTQAFPPDAPATLREIERAAVDAALLRSGGNVSRAAKDLGIGRATLHRRLRAYRMLPEPPSSGS